MERERALAAARHAQAGSKLAAAKLAAELKAASVAIGRGGIKRPPQSTRNSTRARKQLHSQTSLRKLRLKPARNDSTARGQASGRQRHAQKQLAAAAQVPVASAGAAQTSR